MRGLTLGYAILIKRGGEQDRRLMRHELRHVAQYEDCGSITAFLNIHLPDFVAVGYQDARFEVDARAHEEKDSS